MARDDARFHDCPEFDVFHDRFAVSIFCSTRSPRVAGRPRSVPIDPDDRDAVGKLPQIAARRWRRLPGKPTRR